MKLIQHRQVIEGNGGLGAGRFLLFARGSKEIIEEGGEIPLGSYCYFGLPRSVRVRHRE